ncbi:MAG: WD40 repeat domain-containing protein, partial [Chloroflexi bacterium]|nr:WD40 repeat domain-containing protein [Chloroflexota bacterium]
RLLTVGGTIKLWDVDNTATPLYLFSSNTVSYLGARWSSDNDTILAWGQAGASYQADVWNAQNSIAALASLDFDDVINGAAWNPDDERMLIWSADGTTQLWDIRDLNDPDVLVSEGAILGATWNTAGDLVLTWNSRGDISLWNADNLLEEPLLLRHDAMLASVPPEDRAGYGVVWSRDETTLLSWTPDGTVHLWGLDNPIEPHVLSHEASVRQVHWNQARDTVFTRSADDTITRWLLGGGSRSLKLTTQIGGMSLSPDEQFILVWSNQEFSPTERSGVIDILRADDFSRVQEINLTDHEFTGAVWNNDGTRLLTRSRQTATSIYRNAVWDVASGEMVAFYETENVLRAMLWSPDNAYVLQWISPPDSATDLIAIQLWAVDRPFAQPTVLEPSDAIVGARWSQDGTRILSWGADGALHIWQADSLSAPLFTFFHPNAADALPVQSAEWRRDDSLIVAYGAHTITLWDAAAPGAPHATVTVPGTTRILGIDWNAAETHFVPWTFSSGFAVWDASGDEVRQVTDMLAAGETISGVKWSSDGGRLAVWRFDNTVSLWDVATLSTLTLTQPDETIVRAGTGNGGERTLLWREDDAQILFSTTVASDGYIWDTGFEVIQQLARNALFRQLTPEERRAFFLQADEG